MAAIKAPINMSSFFMRESSLRPKDKYGPRRKGMLSKHRRFDHQGLVALLRSASVNLADAGTQGLSPDRSTGRGGLRKKGGRFKAYGLKR